MKKYGKECNVCHNMVEFKADPEDIIRWSKGVHIQEALPYLDSNIRELLISGTCGSCFDELFV